MVKSMTGYGRAEQSLNGRTITVELRSVNNRYLDCSIRIPRLYLFAEDGLKSQVQSSISRGKVDVFVTIDSAGAAGVKRGLDGDDLKAVLFRRRPLDDQRAVDVLAALHGQIEALFL